MAFDKLGAIYSREHPGEPAGFDEAVGILAANHHLADRLVKKSAPGARPAQQVSTGRSGAPSLPRSAFFSMSPDTAR